MSVVAYTLYARMLHNVNINSLIDILTLPPLLLPRRLVSLSAQPKAESIHERLHGSHNLFGPLLELFPALCLCVLITAGAMVSSSVSISRKLDRQHRFIKRNSGSTLAHTKTPTTSYRLYASGDMAQWSQKHRKLLQHCKIKREREHMEIMQIHSKNTKVPYTAGATEFLSCVEVFIGSISSWQNIVHFTYAYIIF